ncbi:MAG: glycosyl transferase family 2 [Planctomycetes bacterium]|jgi:GT2 family glycosyltransferase|nr:glycosyl transferase family 2 [Planctomycetota bacterium]
MGVGPCQTSILATTVNYATPGLALRALESLAAERARLPGLRAVCVDNASPDGSAAELRRGIAARELGAFVELLLSPSNGGFAAGNNLALRAALARPDAPDFILLLNPDAVLDPGALRAMVDFLAVHPDVGIVGPRTEIGRGHHRGSAFRFPGILNSFDEGLSFGPVTRLLRRFQLAPPPRSEAHRTDWVSGGCMLVRREVFEAVGLFDERFFLYFEEVEFSHRAARAGFSSWYLPGASIVHDAGASTGVTGEGELERRIPRYWFESRRRYFAKTRGHIVAWLADLAWVAGASLYRLRRIFGAPRKNPPHFFSDFVRFNLFPFRSR